MKEKMPESVNNLDQRTVAPVCPRPSYDHRRRGSVLVLVMTLLGVLFVTGVAFLATMNFESQLIGSQKLRDRNRIGAGTVVDEVSAILHDGFMAGPGLAFGHRPVGESLTGFADLPGVHNVSAPMEPREIVSSGGVVRYVFDTITDVNAINNGENMGGWFRALFAYQDLGRGLAFAGVDTLWQPGVPVLLDGPSPDLLTIDTDADGQNDSILPVDADGDGISDTLAYPLSDLGFTDTQIAAVSAQLNSPTNRSGEAYLGLRVIAHGGMVNLNESHPQLIANVFDIGTVDLISAPDIELGYFLHRPSSMCDLDSCPKYSSAVEEPLLRRRGLLPPRRIPPSLLHGTPQPAGPTSAPGNADMGSMLYPLNRDEPLGYETVFDHTYTPFSPTDWDAVADAPVWATRMEPFAAGGDKYDRRHLVTTISHDDLLSRGAVWQPSPAASTIDMLELMRQANRAASIPGTCPAVLPFEYADYPQDIPNETIPNFEGSECTCPTDDVCRFDARKGRLQLSLAWLDEPVNCASETDPAVFLECAAVRNRMIYDVFMMLVSNARGPAWDIDVECSMPPTIPCAATEVCRLLCAGGVNVGNRCLNNADCAGYDCGPVGVCVDILTSQSPREELISRTAASLTANMIDYMDLECLNGVKDGMECRENSDCPGGVACTDRGIPTRIAIRSFDFAEFVCVDDTTGMGTGISCTGSAPCGGGQSCLPTAGWEFGSDRLSTVPAQYVYGLERQPYITEVATVVGDSPPAFIGKAIEVFNPHNGADIVRDSDGDGIADYWLVEVDPNIGIGGPTTNRIPLNQTLIGGAFTVFESTGDPFSLVASSPPGRVYSIPSGQTIDFTNGWIVYLVRRVTHPDGSVVEIAVDQFTIDGLNIGRLIPPDASTFPYTASMQRANAASLPWKSTVPAQGADVPFQTLGNWNRDVPEIRPVEVNFANTGSFTKLHPINDPKSSIYNAAVPPLGVAFPTTGSLLLLMRHANRSLGDYGKTPELAFTTWLGRETMAPDPVTGLLTLNILERERVDNGRMPIFDPPVARCFTGGAFGAAACDPAKNCPGGDCLGGTCSSGLRDGELCDCSGAVCLGVVAAHHVMPSATAPDQPGDLESLPWGQLVFDYFTALPLSNPGPYVGADFSGDLDVQPRVDLDGLRVHGRININAAPWKVLAGLPTIPMEKVPGPFRSKIRWGAGFVDPVAVDYLNPTVAEMIVTDDGVSPIGDSLAQSIVAYRELRQIDVGGGSPVTTGNFGDDPVNGRDWTLDNPAARRGSGFLSIGELANVRHPSATALATTSGGLISYHRMELGEVGQPDADYVEALGLLVALGDWVTVRSHVHTVYGTLRGEIDESIVHANAAEQAKLQAADVDKRAVRFQETVDRLPTFLGRQQPVRIGERVVRKYLDVRTD